MRVLVRGGRGLNLVRGRRGIKILGVRVTECWLNACGSDMSRKEGFTFLFYRFFLSKTILSRITSEFKLNWLIFARTNKYSFESLLEKSAWFTKSCQQKKIKRIILIHFFLKITNFDHQSSSTYFNYFLWSCFSFTVICRLATLVHKLFVRRSTRRPSNLAFTSRIWDCCCQWDNCSMCLLGSSMAKL